MNLDDLKKDGLPCLNCALKSISGHWEVDINCSLSPNISLWMMGVDNVRNCKHFITEKQQIRQKKINKIINK